MSSLKQNVIVRFNTTLVKVLYDNVIEKTTLSHCFNTTLVKVLY